MKSTSCFFAACIACSVLPLTMQGAEFLDGEGKPGKMPKVQNRSVMPVVIEIESGIIKLIFTRDLGEITIELQQTSGISEFSRTVDSSVQNQATFIVPTDTYILTVTTADGTILIEETILIP